jgi:hypothetical protein
MSVFSFAASSFGASSFFSAASPSLVAGAAGASEYHRMVGAVATRVLTSDCRRGAKAGVREACLEARRIVLCSIVWYLM